MKPKKRPESYTQADEILMEIGRRFREIRKKKEPNYEDFARKYNLNKVTLSRLEMGKSLSLRLFIHTLLKSGISLQDFFNGL